MQTESVTGTDIERAARQIVRSALRLEPGDGVVVFGDEASETMARATMEAAKDHGVRVWSAWLEDLGRRPLTAIPDSIVRRLQKAGASAFIASAPHQEMRMRQHLLGLVSTLGLRHAHLEGVSELAFTWGLQGDYREISRIGRAILTRLESASKVECVSRWGTSLEVGFEGHPGFIPELGELEKGTFCTLPSGALYATPTSVDGIFVANASLGEFFGRREGSLLEAPVRMTVERARVVEVESESRQLERDIKETLSFGDNSDRVGLVSLGVNLGLNRPTGEAKTDQNLPGLHLVIGDPASKVTGAGWSARTTFAACQADSSVRIDDTLVVHEGVLMSPRES